MRRLFFLGDLHRNFQWLEKTIFENKKCDIILLGDIEFQFQNNEWLKWFKTFNNDLLKYDIHLYCIRGNHDNPFYWFDQTYTFSNVHLVKDYTILDLKYKVLCIGGATSIDRKLKRDKYFKEEEFVYDEDFCNKVTGIDVVVTHSAPEFCYPRGYDNSFLQTYYNIDKDLKSDLIAERATISRMYDVLGYNNTIQHYYYGHFHQSKTELIWGTAFHLLNICEIQELE
jgi:predicted phosphodiesterase